jgi:hypothetical protein
MDKPVGVVLAILVFLALFRFRHSLRKSRVNRNRGDEIRRNLEELRKKRDEE